MKTNVDWLTNLCNSNKGIWCIARPFGSAFNAQKIVELLPKNRALEVVYIQRPHDALAFQVDVNGTLESDFSTVVKSLSDQASDSGRSSLTIIIADFEKADIREQCNLVKAARCLHESSVSISIQLVFFGTWSIFAFRSGYREIHGHTSSPPADTKNLIRVPPWSQEAVLNFLREQSLILDDFTQLDKLGSEFLIEQTGGDEYFIRMVVEHLKLHSGGGWTSYVEQAILELSIELDARSEIERRIDLLSAEARSELMRLLQVHRLVRGYDSVEAEELWLAGLVLRTRVEGGKFCVQIAGPLINTVIRRIMLADGNKSVAEPSALCTESEAISTAAYRRIAQIENMLRNLVSSSWYSVMGENWADNLRPITMVTHQNDQAEELQEMIASVVQSQLLKNGIGLEVSQASETELVIGQNRKTKRSIFDEAVDWQKRQQESPSVELAESNLMHFLTTGSLETVLLNKKSGLCIDGQPFKRDFLSTALEEYRAIRSAVAHNQPIKLSTISRLDFLQRKFIDHVTVFADQKACVDIV